MKRVFVLVLVLIFLSCNPKQSKIEASIKARVDSTFDDPKSYELVEIKMLDTNGVNNDIENEKLYIGACNSLIANNNFLMKNYNLNDLDWDKAMSIVIENEKDLKIATEKLNNLKKFKNGKLGRITHKFRAKNKDGVLKLQTENIFINLD